MQYEQELRERRLAARRRMGMPGRPEVAVVRIPEKKGEPAQPLQPARKIPDVSGNPSNDHGASRTLTSGIPLPNTHGQFRKPRMGKPTKAELVFAIRYLIWWQPLKLYRKYVLYDITLKDVMGVARERPVVSVRRDLYDYLIRTRGLSFSEVGRIMNKDHTTVMHALKPRKSRRCNGPSDPSTPDATG